MLRGCFVCARILIIASARVQLHPMLRLILHSLQPVPVLACMLYAFVNVPHIDGLELELLPLAIRTRRMIGRRGVHGIRSRRLACHIARVELV